MDDEKTPEQERADRLREAIERLTNPPADESEEKPAGPASPREFIERKMRELDERDA